MRKWLVVIECKSKSGVTCVVYYLVRSSTLETTDVRNEAKNHFEQSESTGGLRYNDAACYPLHELNM